MYGPPPCCKRKVRIACRVAILRALLAEIAKVGLNVLLQIFSDRFSCGHSRDTKLGGGLSPNGSLGLYAAPPLTPTWGVKFASGISVRIPLGGGGGSGTGN